MTENQKKELTAKVGGGVVLGAVGMFFMPIITGGALLAWGGYEYWKHKKKNG